MTLDQEVRRALSERPARTFATGFRHIDSLTRGGMRAGWISTIGALTGHGKTALAKQIAAFASVEADVHFFALEIGKSEMLKQFAAFHARCSVDDFENAAQGELDPLTACELARYRILVEGAPRDRAATMDDLEQRISTVRRPIVVIDHVREIDGWLVEGAQSSHIGPTRIVQRFARLAERLNIHVMLCAQLSPPRSPGTHVLAQPYQDTSALEQKTSLSLVLNRPFYSQDRRDVVAEMLVRKNRFGRTARLHYRWVGETMSFWEFSDEELETLECCKPRRTRKEAAS